MIAERALERFARAAKNVYPNELAGVARLVRKADGWYILDILPLPVVGTEDRVAIYHEHVKAAQKILDAEVVTAIHSHTNAYPIMSDLDLELLKEFRKWPFLLIMEVTPGDGEWTCVTMAWTKNSSVPIPVTKE